MGITKTPSFWRKTESSPAPKWDLLLMVLRQAQDERIGAGITKTPSFWRKPESSPASNGIC